MGKRDTANTLYTLVRVAASGKMAVYQAPFLPLVLARVWGHSGAGRAGDPP